MPNNTDPIIFEGTAGADTLIGVVGAAHEFTGNGGNDLMAGFAEADTYIFNRGDGHDGLRDNGSVSRVGVNDRIVFGEGITLDDIRLTKGEGSQAFDLILTITQDGEEVGDSIRIILGTLEATSIEQLVFSDGSTVNLADIPEYVPTVFEGTTGDDTLIGVAGHGAQFIGGTGNDTITSYAEADRYVFNRGDGQDTISDNGQGSGADVIDQIVFGAGITADDIRLVTGSGGGVSDITLILLQDGEETSDRLTLKKASDSRFAIEELAFSDGSTLNVADIPEYTLKVFEGTDGADLLFGVVGASNEFHAGAGADGMAGFAEADSYFFNRGDGADMLRDNGDATRTDVQDRIVFGAGISASDIQVSEGGSSDIHLSILHNGVDVGDRLKIINGQLANFVIEQLEFSDGTSISLADLAAGHFPEPAPEPEPEPEPAPASLRIQTTLNAEDAKYDSSWQGQNGGWQSQDSGTMDASDLINLDAFRSNSEFSHIDGSGFAIAVIDSGLDLDHPFFGTDSDGDGVSDRIVHHQDFTQEGDQTVDSASVSAHGTNVTSIAASSDENFDGVAPGADIVALQALGSGGGSFVWLEKALQWVIDNAEAYNIAAINMSLGTGINLNTLQSQQGIGDELARLEQMGVITVASAGNSYGKYQAEGASYPAIDPSTLAVGAVFDAGTSGQLQWKDAVVYNAGADRLTPFSQRSDEVVDIFAPGAPIYGAAPGGGVDSMTGTSQAAPVVAGAVLLAQQLAVEVLGRKLTMHEFNTAIRESGVDIVDGDDESDSVKHTGDTYQRIDIEAMGQYIKNMARDEVPAPVVDDGNESIDEAVQITVGVDRNGEIEVSHDKDWYSVTLEAGVEYTFSLNGQTLANPYLSLHSPNGVAIASNDDSQGGLDAQITYTPSDAGTYYLNAQASWDGTGTYTVGVVGVEPEPINDIAGDSSTTAVLVSGESQSSGIDFSGDKDWFKVNLETGQSYTFNVKGAGAGVGTLRDAQVKLYNSAGQVVGSDDDSGAASDAQLVVQPEAAGEYFVEVSSWGATDLGTYTIDMHSAALSDDLADDISTQGRLTVGGNVDGEIGFISDRDWYAIELEAGMRYQFDLKGSDSNKGTLADPYLMLYNADGIALARNDDAQGTSDSQVVYSAEQTGTYYLSAGAGIYGLGEGTFNLSASMLEPELPAAPDPGAPGVGTDVSNPYPIRVGWEVNSILREQDETDWFSIYLAAGESYQFDLQAKNTIFGAAMRDPLLYLYDTAQSPLSQDNDSGVGLDSQMTFTAEHSGVYYLGATSADGVDTGGYMLHSQLITETAPPPEDGGSGDAPVVSSPSAIAVGWTMTNNLASEGEIDWYSIGLQAGKTYRFELDSTDYLSYSGVNDTLLHLYDTAQNPLQTDDNSGAGNNAALEFTASQTGVYYLGAATVEDSDLGVYKLSTQEVIDYSQVRDARSITSNTNAFGSLNHTGEVSWYSVQLTAGQSYEFNLMSESPYTSVDINDPLLYLYDSNQNPLMEDDNSGTGNDASLAFTADSTGIYYIGVGTVEDDDLGGFWLQSAVV